MPRPFPLACSVLAGALAVAPAHAVVLKIATLAPEGSSWMTSVRRGADEIARRTERRVTLRFYAGGTMGNDQAVLRKIRIGQLHGGALTSGGLAAVWPDVQILSLPFLFRSYEEVDAVRAQLDGKLIAGLEAHGLVSFGFAEGGFAYLMSSHPIRTLADLGPRKVWIPEGDVIGEAVLAAAGESPVPLPLTDVLTGLQTGLIDTVASSPIGAVALQWFTRVKYLTDAPLLYIYGTLVIDGKAFARVSAADQAVVREVMAEVMRQLDARTREDNRRAREALAEEGIVFVEPTPEARADWERIAAQATRRLGEDGAYGQELYGELVELLAAVRGGED